MISPVPKDSVLLLLPADLHQNDGWKKKGEDRSCAAQPIDGSIHLAGPDEAETGRTHKKTETKNFSFFFPMWHGRILSKLASCLLMDKCPWRCLDNPHQHSHPVSSFLLLLLLLYLSLLLSSFAGHTF